MPIRNDLDTTKDGWKKTVNDHDLLLGSLWHFERRGEGGDGSYHGNFVPQIVEQLLHRYTRKGDWVLDPFVGSGTTLEVALRLGRHSIGIDLSPAALQIAADRVRETRRGLVAPTGALDTPGAENEAIPFSHLMHADTAAPAGFIGRMRDFARQVPSLYPEEVQFVIYHPPYHDIVKFSDEPKCLSNAGDLTTFLSLWERSVRNTLPLLSNGCLGALVIGDMYRGGEWVTLGNMCWEVLQREGVTLKALNVKNYGETTGKGQNSPLWQYRALKGGFSVFQHEYVYVFQK